MAACEARDLGPESTMAEVLAAVPGARRALFRRYHLGGCSSCAFRPEETVAELCARSGIDSPEAMLGQIREAEAQDRRMWLGARELKALLDAGTACALVDTRTREEFEAVRIAGSRLLTQEAMGELMGSADRGAPLVVIDHTGGSALDAGAYFQGHGFADVRCLEGGIDAWAREVEPSMRRYRVE